MLQLFLKHLQNLGKLKPTGEYLQGLSAVRSCYNEIFFLPRICI